ncbi:MAG: DUF4230 domain-containing protein [Acidobacteria bacterium]|nr:DUF4230 domain-containing protein [Acidobacteriota bacterium]MBI3423201.1 DUF4230 domain-containing protein [Acidobacteriota bacterium]
MMQQTTPNRLPLLWLGLAAALIALLTGVVLWQRVAAFPFRNQTNITHSLVLEKVQAVAKLVSSESTMRDVVIYEDTWLGSTKRSLVVVTARVLAGINLQTGADVRIDEAARKISITLPPATLLATDVSEMKTYDEQRGLWNPFEPADRDKIYQQARQQFQDAAQQAKLTEHANQSAKQMLEAMFSRDGFTAEVLFKAQ